MSTFALVVAFSSIRTLLTLVALHGLELHQRDVKSAFQNGALREEVYKKFPEGIDVSNRTDVVCKLNKTLFEFEQKLRP